MLEYILMWHATEISQYCVQNTEKIVIVKQMRSLLPIGKRDGFIKVSHEILVRINKNHISCYKEHASK